MKANRVVLLLIISGMHVEAAVVGQVNVSNHLPRGDALVFDTDCQTLLEGPAYLAQLYYGLSADSLSPVGVAVPVGAGRRAGLFNGGTVSIPEGNIPVF